MCLEGILLRIYPLLYLPNKEGWKFHDFLCEGIESMSNHFLLFGRNQRDFFFSWTRGIEDPTRDWTCAAYREGQPLVHQGSPKSEGFKLRNRPVNTHVHHRNYLKNSLPVQWLGLHTFTAVAHVRPMVGELRSPKLSMHAWMRPQSCPTLHRAERYINTMQFKASHLFPTKFTSSIYSTNT